MWTGVGCAELKLGRSVLALRTCWLLTGKPVLHGMKQQFRYYPAVHNPSPVVRLIRVALLYAIVFVNPLSQGAHEEPVLK